MYFLIESIFSLSDVVATLSLSYSCDSFSYFLLGLKLVAYFLRSREFGQVTTFSQEGKVLPSVFSFPNAQFDVLFCFVLLI